MAQGLASEKVHGMNMNWALYAKWTNNEQHQRKARTKQIEFLNDEDEGKTSLEYKVQEDFGLVRVNIFDKFLWFVILTFVANFVLAICLFVIF
jgi:hypothetical protein